MATERLQRRLWAWYSRSYDGLLDLVPYQRLLDLVVERLAASEGARVVDLGCGTGNLLGRLAGVAGPSAQLVGVDASAEMLARARPKLAPVDRAELVTADVLDWLHSAPHGTFDRIASVNVLYTMDALTRERFWAGLVPLLAPGGRAVFVTTDRAGFGPVLREHLAERSLWSSLRPRLVAVLVLNLLIWALEARQVFDPAPLDLLVAEVRAAGGQVLRTERFYGGETDGVDVLLVIEPVSVDVRHDDTAAVAPELSG